MAHVASGVRRGPKEHMFPDVPPRPAERFTPPERCPIDGSRYWPDEYSAVSGWSFSCLAGGHTVWAPPRWQPERVA